MTLRKYLVALCRQGSGQGFSGRCPNRHVDRHATEPRIGDPPLSNLGRWRVEPRTRTQADDLVGHGRCVPGWPDTANLRIGRRWPGGTLSRLPRQVVILPCGESGPDRSGDSQWCNPTGGEASLRLSRDAMRARVMSSRWLVALLRKHLAPGFAWLLPVPVAVFERHELTVKACR